MNRGGVIYDVGQVFGRGAISVRTRPTFDTTTTQRELEIIKNDLHCNAVRIVGRDVDRLITATEAALEQGLEVWLSPSLFERSPASDARVPREGSHCGRDDAAERRRAAGVHRRQRVDALHARHRPRHDDPETAC
jgi:hypothetical protein